MRFELFRFLGSITLCLLLLLAIGCATSRKLVNLKLQMTEYEVVSVIGEPTAARGAMTNKYGQVIEVWEYALFKRGPLEGPPTLYWLYFYDGKLAQWGEAGDWQKEADRIYEMRFR